MFNAHGRSAAPSSSTSVADRETVEYRSNANGNRIALGPLTSDVSQQSLVPARAYTSEEDFALEQERIFAGGWVWAGFEHWVDEVGKVHPVTIAGRPLLIVRGDDKLVRVFHNSCRHRGMALTEEPIKVTRRLQCSYHCWAYKLDGSLAATPYFQRERGSVAPQGTEQLSLLQAPARNWAGMVFVNLAIDGHGADAPSEAEVDASFDAFIGPVQRRWAHIDFDRIALAEEREFDIAVNWKLVVENFLDFYHLPFVHPQVGPVSASLDVDDEVIAGEIIGGVYPHGAKGKAAKTDGVLPFLGDVPEERTENQDILCVFPNALLFLEADWFQVIGFDTVGPERTVEHMAVFVDRDALGEDHSANRKRLADTLFGVNEQDLPILQKMQAGRYSPGADLTSLATQWDQMTAMFQQIVVERVGYGSTPTDTHSASMKVEAHEG